MAKKGPYRSVTGDMTICFFKRTSLEKHLRYIQSRVHGVTKVAGVKSPVKYLPYAVKVTCDYRTEGAVESDLVWAASAPPGKYRCMCVNLENVRIVNL